MNMTKDEAIQYLRRCAVCLIGETSTSDKERDEMWEELEAALEALEGESK